MLARNNQLCVLDRIQKILAALFTCIDYTISIINGASFARYDDC